MIYASSFKPKIITKIAAVYPDTEAVFVIIFDLKYFAYITHYRLEMVLHNVDFAA